MMVSGHRRKRSPETATAFRRFAELWGNGEGDESEAGFILRFGIFYKHPGKSLNYKQVPEKLSCFMVGSKTGRV